jgi:NADP-dependent 3-hydroxy acid dehydrogenase YdfG
MTSHPSAPTGRPAEPRMATAASDPHGTGPLAGRRVLVTGASSGIGEATARAVVAAGGRVALLARREERLRALVAELGDGNLAVPADVTDPAAVRVAVDRAAEGLGGLDGVVAAAGVLRPGDIADADPGDWRAMFEVNVLGVLHVAQAAMTHLAAAGRGDLVTVSSMSGRRLKTTSMAVYAASKSAVHVVTEGLRRELREHGVRATVVAPGLVRTSLFDGLDDVTSRRMHERAEAEGLTAGTVADAIVGVMTAPPDVVHVEVALMGLGQG